jgi:hypothetical protein
MRVKAFTKDSTPNENRLKQASYPIIVPFLLLVQPLTRVRRYTMLHVHHDEIPAAYMSDDDSGGRCRCPLLCKLPMSDFGVCSRLTQN